MEIIAYEKYIRQAPRKLRLVAKAVKNFSPVEAMAKLVLLRKRAGLPILKALKSAVFNAEKNNHIDKEKLKIKNIIIEEGMRMKRMDRGHGARFNRGVIKKRSSHIKVILTEAEKK